MKFNRAAATALVVPVVATAAVSLLGGTASAATLPAKAAAAPSQAQVSPTSGQHPQFLGSIGDFAAAVVTGAAGAVGVAAANAVGAAAAAAAPVAVNAFVSSTFVTITAGSHLPGAPASGNQDTQFNAAN